MGASFEIEHSNHSHLLKTNIKMPKGSGLTKPLKLSAALADIVGKKEASRAECIKQLWAYLKKHNLQDPENKQYFTPDKKMAKVFGTEKIRGFGMAKFLSDQLTPIDPNLPKLSRIVNPERLPHITQSWTLWVLILDPMGPTDLTNSAMS